MKMKRAVRIGLVVAGLLSARPGHAALTRVNLGIYGGQSRDVVAYQDSGGTTRLLVALDGDIGAVRLNNAGTVWRGAFLGRPGAVNGVVMDVTDSGVGSGAGTLFAMFATGELQSNASEQTGSFSRLSWSTVSNGGVFHNGISVVDQITTLHAASSGVYVGTQSGKIYRSTDGGSTWALLATVSASHRVRSIAIYVDDATNPRLWAVTEDTPSTGSLYPLTYSAGSYSVGAAMSVAGGITAVERVFVYPSTGIAEAPLLFVTGDSPSQSVYRGVTDGTTWSTVTQSLHYFQDMAFDTTNDRIYAVAGVSTDRGLTFSTFDNYSRPEGDIHPNDDPIAIDPNDASRVYVGDDWFLGLWTESAGTWTASGPLASNDGVSGVQIHDMTQVADSSATKEVFAIGGKAGLGVTQDFVTHAGPHPTWTFPVYPLSDGAPITTVRLRDADSNGTVETLFAGNNGAKLYKSTTLGLTAASFTQVFNASVDAAAWLTNPDRSNLSDMAFSPSSTSEMWLAVGDWDGSNVGGAIFCSTDGGDTWSIDPGWATYNDPMAVNALQVTATKFWAGVGAQGDSDPTHRGIYTMVGGLAACTSTTWAPFSTGTDLDDAIVNDLDGPTTTPVYVAASNGLYRGEHSGGGWTFTELTGGAGALALLPDGVNDSYAAVTYNPSPSGYDEEFYAATGDEIYRLRLSGSTWSVALISGSPHEDVEVLLWDALVVGSTGSVASLGDPTDAQDRCLSGFAKARKKLLKSMINAQTKCRDAALETYVSCPDTTAQTALTAALAGLDLTKSCTDTVVAQLSASWPGTCSDVSTVSELEECLGSDVSDIAEQATANEYGAQSPARVGVATTCQTAIGNAYGRKYLVNALKAADRCDRSLRKGKTDVCPDTSMEEKLMKLATKATGTLTSKCTSSDVNALQALGFGGSCSAATSVNALATCQQGDHDALLVDLTTTP